ncbi:uncharacterized protein LOC131841616 [Achroia grisella]|uniref:uncharacterized protein LOC131841616 n=1 Tax=Achroia grisella TaxID=688607 RepID=UPI0027D1EC9C|nr:uncharacterized protein LOC131841616 [Achroia grisella]
MHMASRELLVGRDVGFNSSAIEDIILKLGDAYKIRIVWNKNAVIVTTLSAVAGGLVGGYAGGRLGAAIGAGVAGVTGYGVYTYVSLREIWETIKQKLMELLYIVYNYLRRLDVNDYRRAYDVLMASSKRELVFIILEFITQKLDLQVVSRLTAA